MGVGFLCTVVINWTSVGDVKIESIRVVRLLIKYNVHPIFSVYSKLIRQTRLNLYLKDKSKIM